ncbi:MAG TPA: enoyl-CoA hydratase/isomerase family protein [Thermoanaerobaculia bacterium]|nr:enoyl-CoA hydratase/isomerase family protein [Thermoanaerobaculia bacterium]
MADGGPPGRNAREIEAEGWATLRVERQGERRDLLRVTLDNPEKANALSPAMLRELTALYRRPLLGEGVRAVLLSGAGKHFSAGADLAHLRALQDARYEEHRLDSERLRGLFEAVLRQEALTVALVHGSCVAGGCGLATAHDFVVAAEDARFLYSEVRIGFVAALVATFLPLRVAGRDLRELLLNPELVPAERALEIGLVNRVVPREELEAAGRALAEEVLERASAQSIALTKRLLLEVLGRPLEEALERAANINAAARGTDDCKRGVAYFLEHKKPPSWR